ncbi:hypothetical protein, partial [Mycolicibacterium diernhoferi]|uniref:hypothetical protein n=1 Tax=Mycolicibacterium diernhoferi TaxID=1801 RepID=UPI001A978984
VLSQNQTLQTKTTHPKTGEFESEKFDQTKDTKTGIKKTTIPCDRKTGSPPPRWPKTTNKNHQTHY